MTLDQGVPLVIGVSSVRAESTSGLLLSIFLDLGPWLAHSRGSINIFILYL